MKRGWRMFLVAAMTFLLTLSGCETEPEARTEDEEVLRVPRTIELTSPALGPSGEIPLRYTADGQNISPPLRWTNLPEGTQELVLIMRALGPADRDSWILWIAYKIPADVSGLPEGLPREPIVTEPVTLMQGVNTWGTVGYRGPSPRAIGPHQYYFRLYALDAPLTVRSGLGESDLLRAMAGHILAMGELTAMYERPFPSAAPAGAAGPTTRPARQQDSR